VLGQGLLEHVSRGALGLGWAFGRTSQDLNEKGGQFLRSVRIDLGVDLFGVNALSGRFIGADLAIKEPMVLSFGQGLVSLSAEVFSNVVFDAVAQAIGILVFDHQGVSFSHAPC